MTSTAITVPPYSHAPQRSDSTKLLRELAKSVQNWEPSFTPPGQDIGRSLFKGSPPISLTSVLRQHRSELKEIDGGLQRAREQMKKVLASGGLSAELAEALMTYVDLKVATDVAVTEIVANEMRSSYARRDPIEPLSAAELAAMLGVSDETVRNREQAGELFSVLRAGRKRGREYPAFQAWDGIAGEPLKKVLEALGRPTGPVAYAFFTSPQDALEGLSPIEALTGLAELGADEAVRELLSQSDEDRHTIVVRTAQTYAAALAA